MTLPLPRRLRRLSLLGLMLWAAGMSAAVLRSQGATPQFRAGVDLVRVEVQVVDASGVPVAGIEASSFDVRIDGRKRQVTSAQLIRETTTTGTTVGTSSLGGPTARNVWPEADGAAGRTFVLAIDTASLSGEDGVSAAKAGREFVDRLSSGDAVGVVELPRGGVLSPTKDRQAIRTALSRIVGHRSTSQSQFHLSAAEVVDMSADLDQADASFASSGRAGRGPTPALNSALQSVQTRECRGTNDTLCLAQLILETQAQTREMEERVYETSAGLDRLLKLLAESPGRKTVVLMSGGLPISERWLQDGAALRDLGRAAALASSTVYAIHFDEGLRSVYNAETRSARPTVSLGRERAVQQRLLESFAVTSGGALFSAPVDSGQSALARVLLETSGVYVLGVVPDKGDLDGRPHELKVNVSQRGVTLRSLRYVVLRRN